MPGRRAWFAFFTDVQLKCFVVHQNLKLFEVYFPVSIEVGLSYHRLDLRVVHRLPEVAHGGPQLVLRDEAVSINVKHPEALGNVVLEVATVVDKELNELVKVNTSLVTVNVLDHSVKFSLGGTEAMLPQNLK